VLDNATGEAKAAIDEEKLNKALDEAKKSEDDKLVELNIKKVENAMLTYNSFRRNSSHDEEILDLNRPHGNPMETRRI